MNGWLSNERGQGGRRGERRNEEVGTNVRVTSEAGTALADVSSVPPRPRVLLHLNSASTPGASKAPVSTPVMHLLSMRKTRVGLVSMPEPRLQSRVATPAVYVST